MRPATTTDSLAPDDAAQPVATSAPDGARRPQAETDLLWQDPSGPRDAGGDNFVELKVLLTDEAYRCLESASEISGDNCTDVVNRALVMYAAIQDGIAHGGGNIAFKSRNGQNHRAVIA